MPVVGLGSSRIVSVDSGGLGELCNVSGVYFAAMSVPYMLAFPAFGSLISSVPPILVSMAGYILVFAAFLLV